MAPPPAVFFSYAHKDEPLRDELAKHLSLLARQGVITTWHDREITAGTEWAGKIDQQMEAAQLILLLISADFLASDYCYDIELQRAMQRHDRQEARVIPVILRPVDWQTAAFAKLQPLPQQGKPVTTWANQDEAFVDIVRGIRRVIAEVTSAPLSRQAFNRNEELADRIPENLPRSGAVKFVGRFHWLEQLYQTLKQDDRVTAITGMGGVGKTELALQYALMHKSTYRGGICWLQVRGMDVGTQIVQFARSRLQLNPSEELNLLAQVGFCWSHWPPGEVLIVFDDVTDYELIEPYLPPKDPCFRVLMTTRLRLGRAFNRLEIDVLEETEALVFLESLIGAERVQPELDTAKALCVWLGYLPLGIELVGRYLDRKADWSLSDMLNRLQSKRLEERSLQKPEADMTAQSGVGTAFALSWDALSPNTKQLACLLSLFAAAPIPWSLVEQCWPDQDPDDLEEIRDDSLVNLHLLQRKAKGIYQLHQLIREFLQEKHGCIDQAEDLRQQFCQAMVAIAQQVPESPTRSDILKLGAAMPHVAECASRLSSSLSDADLLKPFVGLGRFYEGQGFYERAEQWFQQCCSTVEARFGASHPSVAASLDYLGSTYRNQGQYAQAEALCVQALELRQQLLGDRHLDVADSLNNVALLYTGQTRYSEAEPLYGRSLDIRRQYLGNDHPDVADSLNNLGLLYSYQGRYADAEPLLIQALALRQRILGPDHPRVATSLNNLAYCYTSQGQYTQAEPLYLEALALSQRLLGDEHPDVATALNNLAHLYVNLERYAEAEPLFSQALDLQRRSLGAEHPNVATSLNNLALLYDIQGRYREAEPLYMQALEIRRQVLGEQHLHVAISLNNLAKLYYAQQRYPEAEPLYVQALAILDAHPGKDHPITVKVRSNFELLQGAANHQPGPKRRKSRKKIDPL